MSNMLPLHSAPIAVVSGAWLMNQLMGFDNAAAGARSERALCAVSYICVLYDLAYKKGIFDIEHIDKVSNLAHNKNYDTWPYP
jgi:hypothetical protein